MTTNRDSKLAIEFNLSLAEVNTLTAAGLDTPRRIREAAAEHLPAALQHKLARYHRAARVAKTRAAAPDLRADFTAIPRIGKELQGALYNAGFETFADLRAASDEELLALPSIHTSTLASIRAYLAEHTA